MKQIGKVFCRIAVAAICMLAVVASLRMPVTACAVPGIRSDADAMAALMQCDEYVRGNKFTTHASGFIRTRVFGIPCKQTVVSTREVDGENFHAADESRSAFVNVAFDRTGDGNDYSVATGEYKKKRFVFGEPATYTRDEYVALYGLPPIGLCKFDIYDDCVIEARRVDDNTFTYVLDPAKASAHCVNQILSLTEGNAEYEYAEITLITDGMRPLSVKIVEKFRVEKFGGLKCNSEYTENFEYVS